MSDGTPQNQSRRKGRWAVVLITAVAVIVTAVFVIEFAAASVSLSPDEETEIDARYTDSIEPMLADADTAQGETLVTETYECFACHVSAAGRTAPPYSEISDHAEAAGFDDIAQYIYLSIVHPAQHVVEGYAAAMPQNYGVRMSDEELAHVIAYLLAQ